jgi:hypothetical protein
LKHYGPKHGAAIAEHLSSGILEVAASIPNALQPERGAGPAFRPLQPAKTSRKRASEAHFPTLSCGFRAIQRRKT